MGLLIGDVFRRNAAAVPRRIAASLDDEVLSYGQLQARASRLGRALLSLGVRRGDRVMCWCDTELELVPLFAALAQIGAAFAPVNARLGAEEAASVAALARAKLLVSDAPRAEASESVARAAGVQAIAHLGGARGPGADLRARAAAERADPLPDAPHGAPPGARLDERDPHVIFFTSGSTGRPKGVVLSHRANTLRSFAGVFRDAPERSACMFPLFHMAGWTLALGAWQSRGEMHFVRQATAEALLEVVTRRHVSRLYCIPAVWWRVLSALDAAPGRFDTSSLREVDTGTSATPPELIEAIKARLPGTTTRVLYGSTEAGAGSVLPDADVLRKPGSVGLPAPGVDLRLAAGGEIEIRSEYLMDGYFDDPEATAAALVDGWYRTGDLGAFDDEGYLAIVGRARDIIRTGGESVAPAEVEAALADHPAVSELAVVGIPDPKWGEIVCAVAVPAPGAAPTLEALRRHCAGRLAGFKQPRRLECVEALPRTAATGQVQRALLLERIAGRG